MSDNQESSEKDTKELVRQCTEEMNKLSPIGGRPTEALLYYKSEQVKQIEEVDILMLKLQLAQFTGQRNFGAVERRVANYPAAIEMEEIGPNREQQQQVEQPMQPNDDNVQDVKEMFADEAEEIVADEGKKIEPNGAVRRQNSVMAKFTGRRNYGTMKRGPSAVEMDENVLFQRQPTGQSQQQSDVAVDRAEQIESDESANLLEADLPDLIWFGLRHWTWTVIVLYFTVIILVNYIFS